MAKRFELGQKVKFTHPSTKNTETGHVGHIDLGSGLIQLSEWLEQGKRCDWHPQDCFEAVK